MCLDSKLLQATSLRYTTWSQPNKASQQRPISAQRTQTKMADICSLLQHFVSHRDQFQLGFKLLALGCSVVNLTLVFYRTTKSTNTTVQHPAFRRTFSSLPCASSRADWFWDTGTLSKTLATAAVGMETRTNLQVLGALLQQLGGRAHWSDKLRLHIRCVANYIPFRSPLKRTKRGTGSPNVSHDPNKLGH
jgi:hypothetical protein